MPKEDMLQGWELGDTAVQVASSETLGGCFRTPDANSDSNELGWLMS